MRSRARLHCQPLEDRLAPATFGIPWGDPRHLTLSFAPDQTAVGSQGSTLFQTLNANYPGLTWQSEILRAAQTWAAVTNLDLGVVGDKGHAFGSDVNGTAGHLRIGAVPLAPSALAIGNPPNPYFGESWSGEVVYNASNSLDPNLASLYSVFLHEFGHALGLGGSANPASVMYQQSGNPAPTLSADDIVAIRNLYGTRQPDQHDLEDANDTRPNASRVDFDDFNDPASAIEGRVPLLFFGDVTTHSDVDYYRIEVPHGYIGGMTVQVRTSGISLLAPKVSITNQAGTLLGTSTSMEPGGGIASIQLTGVTAGSDYYVRVEGATVDVFGIGRYAAVATFDAIVAPTYLARVPGVLIGPNENLDEDDLTALLTSAGPVYLNDDSGTDDTLTTATPLSSAAQVSNFVGSIALPTDIDVYRVRTTSSDSATLTATVRIPQTTSTAIVQIVNAAGFAMPTSVLFRGDGRLTLQAIGLKSDTDYFVRVTSPTPTNYELSVITSDIAATPHVLAEGQLYGDIAGHRLVVVQSHVFHFLLGATGPAGQSVRMTVTNEAGAVVYQTITPTGQSTNGRPVLLTPGVYLVRYTPMQPIAGLVSFRLTGAVLSDPIGPQVPDPAQGPAGPAGSLSKYYLTALKQLGKLASAPPAPQPGA